MAEDIVDNGLTNGRPILLGTKLCLGSESELLSLIEYSVVARKKCLVQSGNAMSYNLAFEQAWFREYMNRANWILLDGVGLQIAAKILGYEPPSRMTWADFIPNLAGLCGSKNFSLFFLGGKPGIAQKAADRLTSRFKNLRIVGTHHGYFDKALDSRENETVIEQINYLRPDLLLVGFGMPIQELWLKENWERLNASVGLTCGGFFDILSGELPRPPRWMCNSGLEWLGRLMIEPSRLWRRYLFGNSLFLYRLFKERMKSGRQF